MNFEVLSQRPAVGPDGLEEGLLLQVLGCFSEFFSLSEYRFPEGTANAALLTRLNYHITAQFPFNVHNFLCCSEKLIFL